MRVHILSVVGYVLATFASQGASHFLVFAEHYAAVSHIKAEPIFALGFLSMIIQGSVVSFVFANSRFSAGTLFDAIKFAWLFGAFLVSYIALAEAAKYSVPNVLSWIAVEIVVGFFQFTLVGIVLRLAHGGQTVEGAELLAAARVPPRRSN
jgi:hypothetical protein